MKETFFVRMIMHLVQHYNHKKYWKMRSIVVNPTSKVPKIIKLWYLFRIKRMDAFNNASTGGSIGGGQYFYLLRFCFTV